MCVCVCVSVCTSLCLCVLSVCVCVCPGSGSLNPGVILLFKYNRRLTSPVIFAAHYSTQDPLPNSTRAGLLSQLNSICAHCKLIVWKSSSPPQTSLESPRWLPLYPHLLEGSMLSQAVQRCQEERQRSVLTSFPPGDTVSFPEFQIRNPWGAVWFLLIY